jgi:hypothetical protein
MKAAAERGIDPASLGLAAKISQSIDHELNAAKTKSA